MAARAKSIPVSGDILKSKAEELNEELDSEIEDTEKWMCSNEWISWWKVRHNIKYRSAFGDHATVDIEVCTNLKHSVLMPTLTCYMNRAEDVYGADETGL